MQDKLIIWDFDGVIADTEKIWLQNRMMMLNDQFGLKWDLETTNKFLGGMADKTKKDILDKLGIQTNKEFWDLAFKKDINSMLKGFSLTEGIEDIFKIQEFNQCIATGGIASKTKQKIEIVGIEKYFPMDKVFTADMVKFGKPEPDIFLLAAEKMGYNPKNCIVIEDSLAGMTAALKAEMFPIAFIGSDLYNKKQYTSQIKEIGIKYIFDNMKDIKKKLLTLL